MLRGCGLLRHRLEEEEKKRKRRAVKGEREYDSFTSMLRLFRGEVAS